MLLPIKATTPRSKLFTKLNAEFLHFLRACEHANAFEETLFSESLRSAIWGNQPTRDKFHLLWVELKEKGRGPIGSIIRTIVEQQAPAQFYTDTSKTPPSFDPTLEEAIGDLTKHLFKATTKLVQIETECGGETLGSYFNAFRIGNHEVCSFCATEKLAPLRTGIADADQWRAPFDHLLPKEKYPIYAIHPDNLIPSCKVCNEKAKLAKDLIFDAEGARRRSFYPYTESAAQSVWMVLARGEIALCPKIYFIPADPEVAEKLATWNQVYCITERIEGWFREVIAIIACDCFPNSAADLKEKIEQKARECRRYCSSQEMTFWKFKLYAWLKCAPEGVIEELWQGIAGRRDDQSMVQEFGEIDAYFRPLFRETAPIINGAQ
jgi:hypothetical protein